MECENDGLWSNEGVDVYTTYRLMEEKYGKLYAQQNYVDKWKTAVDEQDAAITTDIRKLLKNCRLSIRHSLKKNFSKQIFTAVCR